VVYFAYSQTFPEAILQMVYALRTAGDPIAVVNTVREIVHQADSRVPVSDIRTQTAEIDGEIKQEIAFAKLCSAFALLALAIACVGLYGTISYSAARRTGEIGIRMALGAQRAGVVRMILRQVLVLTAIGLLIGLPTALGVSRFVQSFLYGMKPNDPLAMIAAVASLLSAAILAGYFPARKASRVDPMVALRHE
jgi:ABC-type antimicrobial peptide transport system permease subunit